MIKHTLNVWPEHSTGKWIVSSTQPGTNNEKVFAECWAQADANLIAAAPELLEALKVMIDSGFMLCHDAGDVPEWNEGGHAYEAIAQARAAIAKAIRN